MKVAQRNSREVLIIVEDNNEENIYEVDIFLNSLIKLKKIINSTGYTNKFNKDEKALWDDIFSEFVFPEDKPKITITNELANYVPPED